MLEDALNVVLAVGLTVVMFGLGLTLHVDDFLRIGRNPRPVLVALLCQTVVVPAVGLGLVMAFRLNPSSAIGVMVLLASPGGALANLLSHLADGDLALNLTLTALNAAVAVVSLPVVVQLAVAYLGRESQEVMLQYDKLFGVLVLEIGSVAAGMWVGNRSPEQRRRFHRSLRLATGVVVVVGASAIGVQYAGLFADGLLAVGGTCNAREKAQFAGGACLVMIFGLMYGE